MMHQRAWRPRVKIAIVCVLTAVMGFSIARSPAEEKGAWQPGTILEVKVHHPDPDSDAEAKQYDVSVKVGNRIYTTLYNPQKEDPDLENYVGMARMVLIDKNTLKFNDLLGRTHSLRILSFKDAPPKDPK